MLALNSETSLLLDELNLDTSLLLAELTLVILLDALASAKLTTIKLDVATAIL